MRCPCQASLTRYTHLEHLRRALRQTAETTPNNETVSSAHDAAGNVLTLTDHRRTDWHPFRLGTPSSEIDEQKAEAVRVRAEARLQDKNLTQGESAMVQPAVAHCLTQLRLKRRSMR